MGDERRGAATQSGTPWGELERIDEQRGRREEARVRQILEAMLEASGERGYRRVAVQDVIDRYGGNRAHFYRHFSGKADCYATAHALGLARLSDRLLGAAAPPAGWQEGVRGALDELAAFAVERPQLARGLVLEVQVAGGECMERRNEAIAGFARTLDRGREDSPAGRTPPALSAPLLVGAVESALGSALARGEPEAFRSVVPELAHLIVSTYLGEEAAAAELSQATP